MTDVTHHGVVPDGTTLNTAALQRLIDRGPGADANRVYFPPGRYLTGGLVLRGAIELQLARGATILGSPRLEDYHHYVPAPESFPEGYEGVRALFSAVDAEDIAITGPGTIDGQGRLFEAYAAVRGGRPRVIWFARCRNVRLDGLALRNSGFWMQHYIGCTGVRLTNLDIWNHGSTNNDGLDIDGCRDVLVAHCRIDSTDDAICLKAGNGRPTENVRVTNCFTRTHCNHFKLGTESRGDFRNITVDGIVMTPSSVRDTHSGTQGADWRGACGIALGAVDGGGLAHVTIENVRMDQVRVPFFVRLGDRAYEPDGRRHTEGPGAATGIILRNIEARGASSQPSFIAGLADAPVRNVVVESCRLEVEGGGPAPQAPVPEAREAYPSWETFGPLPASALYVRHAEGVLLRDVIITQRSPDARPAVVWESCRDTRVEGLKTTRKSPFTSAAETQMPLSGDLRSKVEESC